MSKNSPSVDPRTNFEKLDDAGLATDVVFAKYQATLDALAPELVDEMIAALNSKEAEEVDATRGTSSVRPKPETK